MKYTDKLFAYDNLFPTEQLKIDVGEIFQVSELSLMPGGEISLHHQQCDEITFVISGSAQFYSDDICDTVTANQLHFIRKGFTHRIVASSNENFRFVCIGLNPNRQNAAIKALYDALSSQPYMITNDNGTVKNLSEFLIREFYNQDEYSKDMINQYISQILITMTRILYNKTYDYRKNSTERTANFAMYKLLRFIDREYLQISSIKSIAKTLSYSEYYLSHLFKEKMGMTIKEYLTKKKIAYATELLRNTELTIEEISDQLQFSSAHAFRRSFKQYTLVTPSEYKKKANRNFCTL